MTTAARISLIVGDVAAGLVVVVVAREVFRTVRFAKRARDHLAELAELQRRAAAGDELAALRIIKLTRGQR